MSAREELLARVARLLEELGELAFEVAVVGGTAPALYDLNAAVSVRATRDIDLLIGATSKREWYRFVGELEARGFRYSTGEPICRYRKGELIIDVMPTDDGVLGFGNRWYREAFAARQSSAVGINVVPPLHFIATKLDAYEQRGKGDALASHDIEDVVTVLVGNAGTLTSLPDSKGRVADRVKSGLARLIRKYGADLLAAHVEQDEATQDLAAKVAGHLAQLLGPKGAGSQ